MLADKVVLEGIFSKGYGTIAKLVMKDKDLSVEAKAIYAYLCSYSGSGESAFPSVNLIKEDLNISENRFLKHRKVLVEKGYISIKRNKKSNGWSNNIYTIHTVVHLQNEGIQNVGIQNEGTNNNSITNNSINNNKSNKDIAKKKKSIKESYGEFENVLLTKEEHQKLQERFPNDLKQIRDAWSSADSIVRTAIVICVAIVLIVGILYGVDMTWIIVTGKQIGRAHV